MHLKKILMSKKDYDQELNNATKKIDEDNNNLSEIQDEVKEKNKKGIIRCK